MFFWIVTTTVGNFRVARYSPTKPELGSLTSFRQGSLRAKAIFCVN
jgi:hypothetical protein